MCDLYYWIGAKMYWHNTVFRLAHLIRKLPYFDENLALQFSMIKFTFIQLYR